MTDIDDLDDLTSNEFGAADLGDPPRTQRLVALARQLSQSPHCSFPQSLDSAQLKTAYRFFGNEEIDSDGVLGSHVAQTLGRMREVPVVLAVQDTTGFNPAHLPETTDGGLGTGGNRHGFLMHSLLAVTPEGLPLGLLGMKTWVRDPEEAGKGKQRRQRDIRDKESDKESVKWLEGLERLETLKEQCPDTRLVGVTDREGDVYDVFNAPRSTGVDWLVRAAWNRRVEHPEQYLWDAVEAAPALGQTTLQVPGSGKAPARSAQLTVRCLPVQLRPARSRPVKEADVEVFVIYALEVDAPQGVEPLEWMLLTSVPTHTHEQALERLAWYARRWTIESWHRVLKSGCRVEAKQFGDLDRFVDATALFAVISWRILYATLLARLDGDLPCEVLLQPIEWRALYCRVHRTKKTPANIPSLAQAVLWIAKLGGYLGRKNDRPPGPTPIWRGFLALQEITKMYRIFQQDE